MRVKGLQLGADDYPRKLFSLSELEAHMDSVQQVGALSIDDRAKEVRIDGELIALTPKEYLLASEPGRVFSSDEIILGVWGDLEARTDKADVKQYIHLLRKKIGDPANKSVVLSNTPGFGYKLIVQ